MGRGAFNQPTKPKTMTTNQAEANYAQFSRDPSRIDGAVHNTVTARLGTAFDYNAGEPLDAVEIAFVQEPYGNVRSILVADLAAAKGLRDQLDQILKEHALIPPTQVDSLGTAPGMPTSSNDRFNA
jgi:hypothetical protein